jgi:hypothetical protein
MARANCGIVYRGSLFKTSLRALGEMAAKRFFANGWAAWGFGASRFQLRSGERVFPFRDGPLDCGPDAAAGDGPPIRQFESEQLLADLIYQFGEGGGAENSRTVVRARSIKPTVSWQLSRGAVPHGNFSATRLSLPAIAVNLVFEELERLRVDSRCEAGGRAVSFPSCRSRFAE